jgi:hypothetical protein
MDRYVITVDGHIGDNWKEEWFPQCELTRLSNGDTLLSGIIRDQAQLHGILNNIRDLGVKLKRVDKK